MAMPLYRLETSILVVYAEIYQLRILLSKKHRNSELKLPVIKIFFRSAGWTAGGAIASRLFTMISYFILARIISKSDFGEWAQLQISASLFASLSGFGIHTIVSKKISEKKTKEENISGVFYSGLNLTKTFCLLSFILCSVVFIIEPSVFNSEFEIFLIVMIMAQLMAISAYYQGALYGLAEFRKSAIVLIKNSFYQAALICMLAYIFGFIGVCFAYCVSQIQYIFSSHLILKDISDIKKTDSKEIVTTALLAEGLPITLVSILVMAANWISTLMLINTVDGSSKMAEYAVGLQWRNLIVFLPSSIVGIVIPSLASARLKGDFVKMNSIVRMNVYMAVGVSVAAAAFIYMIAPLIGNAYGQDYASSTSIIRASTVVAVLLAINTVAGNVITALGNAWHGVIICTLTSALICLLSYIFIPKYAAMGLVYSSIIAYAIHSILQYLLLRYYGKNIRLQKNKI